MQNIKDLNHFFFKSNNNRNEPAAEPTPKGPEKQVIEAVPGLILIKNYITKAEESLLLGEINKREWNTGLKRRVQQYGYEYDYSSKNMAASLGSLPDFLGFLIDRIMEEKLVLKRPDQCIVNEYEPGQGISDHIDKPHLFEDGIISVSLASDVVMDFTSPDDKKKSILLPRRSLVLLTEDSRYKWKHGIAGRKKDKLDNGEMLIRKKRISLTFRHLIKKQSS